MKRRRLFPATAAMVVFAMLSAAPLHDARAEGAVRFQDTAAAQAFARKDYATALDEFQALLDANPGNVLVMRYTAITLDLLGRVDDAMALYDDAIALAPGNAELHYHRGVTAYNANRGSEAIASFRRAAELAPQSRYAELSARYLDAIAEQYAQRQPVGKPKRFGVYALVGYQHDDNISARPDDAPGVRDGDRYTGYVNLDYHLHQSPEWLVTTSVNAYGSWYEDALFDDFEIPQYMGSLRLQKSGTTERFPYLGTINYDYRRVEFADGELYSRSHALTLGLRLSFERRMATYGYYQYTDDDFADEGFDPVFSSRDADNHLVGLRQTWFVADGRGDVSVELKYERNRADGLNFDMDGVSGTVSARMPLPADWFLDVSATYGKEDYDRFAGPVARETTRRQATIGLSRWFAKRFNVRFDYSYLDEASSYDVLSFDRYVWGVSVSYAY